MKISSRALLSLLTLLAVWGLAFFLLKTQTDARARLESLTRQEQAVARERARLETERLEAEELGDLITPEELARLLAPSDRMASLADLAALAQSAFLSHVAYHLTPAKPFEGHDDLAQSTLTLEAQATLDTDALRFWTQLQAAFPGKLSLRRFSLERIAPGPEESLPTLKLRLDATWLTNAERGGKP